MIVCGYMIIFAILTQTLIFVVMIHLTQVLLQEKFFAKTCFLLDTIPEFYQEDNFVSL